MQTQNNLTNTMIHCTYFFWSVSYCMSCQISCYKHQIYRRFTFIGLCVVNVLKYNQQDVTLYNGMYYCKCSTCFRWFSAHYQELKSLYTASCICRDFFCFLPLSWVSWNNSLTIGLGAEKTRQIPDAVYTVLSSWWWAEESPETCRAFIVINTIA